MKLYKVLSTLFYIGLFIAIGGTMVWVGASKQKVEKEDAPTVYHSIEEVDIEGAQWITVEEAELDILGSEFFTDKGTDEVFIPITCIYGEFYLQTSDMELRAPLIQFEQLLQASRALENSIQMSEKDPEYEKFKGVSVEEQRNAMNLLQQQIDQFIEKHPPITVSISGILNPAFDAGKKKDQLGFGDQIHIIKHQESPGAGIYSAVLLYGGWILLIIGGFGFIGFLTSKKKA